MPKRGSHDRVGHSGVRFCEGIRRRRTQRIGSVDAWGIRWAGADFEHFIIEEAKRGYPDLVENADRSIRTRHVQGHQHGSVGERDAVDGANQNASIRDAGPFLQSRCARQDGEEGEWWLGAVTCAKEYQRGAKHAYDAHVGCVSGDI